LGSDTPFASEAGFCWGWAPSTVPSDIVASVVVWVAWVYMSRGRNDFCVLRPAVTECDRKVRLSNNLTHFSCVRRAIAAPAPPSPCPLPRFTPRRFLLRSPLTSQHPPILSILWSRWLYDAIISLHFLQVLLPRNGQLAFELAMPLVNES
jgi:hypothetical protein